MYPPNAVPSGQIDILLKRQELHLTVYTHTSFALLSTWISFVVSNSKIMKGNDPTDPAENGQGMATSVADFEAGHI